MAYSGEKSGEKKKSPKFAMTPYETIAVIVSSVSLLFLFFIGIIYRIYEEFIYKYAFSIRNTIDVEQLAGEMRVGRFGIFIGIWILLLIFNMAICAIVTGKCDYISQMKLTSILYVSFVALTFVLIGLIPSLVEIFENTFGLFVVSTRPMAWLFQYGEIMKVFKSKLFKNNKDIVIPFDSVLPLFNIRTFEETFAAIDKESMSMNVSDKTDEASDAERFDFWFDYNEMCIDDNQDADNAKQNFKNALFKLCFAKYNAGHFAWVYIATIVTMLSVAAVK